MDKFSQNKNIQDSINIHHARKERLLALMSILLLAVLIGIVIFNFQFLILTANKSINANLIKDQDIVKFNLDQLEEIKSR